MDYNKNFPDVRESGENKLQQSQQVMLRLLKIFDFLCRKHGIEYFLTFGTLLGAIRHNGFIPWDDDMDVGMTYENYNKFLKLAVPELPKDIFFQNSFTDPHYSNTDPVDAKLRDRYSSYTHLNGSKKQCHDGLQLDIFVYHKAYLPNKYLIIIQNIILNIFWSNPQKRAYVLQKIEQKNYECLVYCNNWYQNFGMLKFSAEYVREEEIKKNDIIEFEDMKAYIPSGYDSYLHRKYGDYMKLPPKNKRRSHHDVIAEPFICCDHIESLSWKEKPH
jgi:lipopolysaccharide cholinephosphotransferase